MTFVRVVARDSAGQFLSSSFPWRPEQVAAESTAMRARHPGAVITTQPLVWTPPAVQAPASEELDNVKRLCSADRIGIELTTAQAAAVLAEWHQATGGLRISDGWPGTVGVRAYRWLRAKSGADERGIDGAERLAAPELVDPFVEHLVRHPDYVDPKRRPRRGQWITELDVNGSFHASAGIELGTGDPVLIPAPRDIGGYLGDVGYVRLARDVRTGHPAWLGLRAGRTLAMTTAAWLIKQGHEIEASEALVWPRHRRHLDNWYRLFRDARQALIQRTKTGRGPAAAVALQILKSIVTTTLGGWIRSEKNHSEMLRRDWSDMIMAEAWVRQMAAMGRAEVHGWWPIGIRRDAAWFCTDQPGVVPPGIQCAEQLGKWKVTRSVPVTPEIIAAHRGGPEKLLHAILAAHRSQGAATPDRPPGVRSDLTPG
jgi:hypothetical protein